MKPITIMAKLWRIQPDPDLSVLIHRIDYLTPNGMLHPGIDVCMVFEYAGCDSPSGYFPQTPSLTIFIC